MNDETIDLDVAIIGAGPAGMSAAVWCRELGLEAIVFEREGQPGGQLRHIYNPIRNYLGLPVRDGRELCERFLTDMAAANIPIQLASKVTEIQPGPASILVRGERDWRSRAVILATGVRRRRLGVPGEVEFAGKGVLTSGSRDRESAKGKTALIVGGGDAALENALILSEYASRVMIIHRGKEFRARDEFVRDAASLPHVEFAFETAVTGISGDERVRSVTLGDLSTGVARSVEVEVVLIRIGVEPNSELLKNQADLDRQGYVLVDQLGRTSVRNIYAVGDVSNPVAPTIASAAGIAAAAAKAVRSEIDELE